VDDGVGANQRRPARVEIADVQLVVDRILDRIDAPTRPAADGNPLATELVVRGSTARSRDPVQPSA